MTLETTEIQATNGPLFTDFNLDPRLLDTLASLGHSTPTPVQIQAIPVLLAGGDVMASAQTGTGKTGAFVLPTLQRIAETRDKAGRGPRALILTPTRELAQQVAAAAAQYGAQFPWLKVAAIVGGEPYPVQQRLLAKPIDLLIATPGRLLDHVNRGRIDLANLEFLVLDEADRMLDMGFIDDVTAIAAMAPASRQTALFSATLGTGVVQLAGKLLKNPTRVAIETAAQDTGRIEQRIHYTDDLAHKNKLLDHLLADATLGQAIVFTATKADAASLTERLQDEGWAAAELHGDLPQRARTRTIAQLRAGRVQILVATDVAARGIDVDGITHVINYDLPMHAEDYVHRIGRTGRAGRTGLAISLVSHREKSRLFRIEKLIGTRLFAGVIPGMEPRQRPKTSFSDKPRGNFGDKPRGNYGNSSYGDKPRSSFGDKPRSSYGDAPRGNYGDTPRAGTNARAGNPFTSQTASDRPFSDRGAERSYGGPSDRPQGAAPRAYGDRPRSNAERSYGGERSYNDRPRSAADTRTGGDSRPAAGDARRGQSSFNRDDRGPRRDPR